MTSAAVVMHNLLFFKVVPTIFYMFDVRLTYYTIYSSIKLTCGMVATYSIFSNKINYQAERKQIGTIIAHKLSKLSILLYYNPRYSYIRCVQIRLDEIASSKRLLQQTSFIFVSLVQRSGMTTILSLMCVCTYSQPCHHTRKHTFAFI